MEEVDDGSHVLQLQVEALLSEVAVGTAALAKRKKNATLYTGLTKVESLVRSLKDVLEQMPEGEIAAAQGSLVAGVPLHHDYSKGVQISSPQSIDLIGSYMLGSTTRPNLNIDLAVEMPSSMFDADLDIQDFRYFDKRALYLARLASYLRTKEPFIFSDLSVTFFRGESLKPILVLYASLPVENSEDSQKLHLERPSGMLSRFVIRIFPTIARDLFPTRKLVPQRNNTKMYVDRAIPTPDYNQLIIEDSLFVTHFESLAVVAAQVPAFAEAASLLKVWATHRGLTAQGVGSTFKGLDADIKSISQDPEAKSEATGANVNEKPLRSPSSLPQLSPIANAKSKKSKASPAVSSIKVVYEETPLEDSFNGFLFSMLIEYLLRQGKVLPNMPALKIFHLVLAFIAGSDLALNPISIADLGSQKGKSSLSYAGYDGDEDGSEDETKDTNKSPDAPSLSIFAAAFEVTFVDGTGLLNLASRISASSYRLLRHEALLSIVYLEGVKHLDSLVTVKTLSRDDMASILGAGALHITDSQVFETLFMTTLNAYDRYDIICKVEVELEKLSLKDTARGKCTPIESLIKWGQELPIVQNATSLSVEISKAPHEGPTSMLSILFPRNPHLSTRSAIARRAYPLILRAVGTRSYLVSVIPSEYSTTKVCFNVCFLLRADDSSRLMDKGPIADQVSEVNEWRDFWGPKSELRRFHDGTIHESVAWVAPSGEEYLVSPTIVDYILNYNLLKPVSETSSSGRRFVKVKCTGSDLSVVMKLRGANEAVAQFSGSETQKVESTKGLPSYTVARLPSEDASTVSAKINAAFQELSLTLQDLTDMPLGISSIEGAHPALRGTDPFPPLPISLRQFRKDALGALPRMTPGEASQTVTNIASQNLLFRPMDVIVTLNFSNNWPSELLALSRTKTAFLIKIHNLLREQVKVPATVTAFHVDAFIQGFVFRIRISLEKETSMIRQLIRMGKPLPPLMASSGLSTRDYLILHDVKPRHASMIEAISGRYAIFAPIARLFRRWLSAHFFDSSSISPEAAELLVASVFTFPQPYTVPASVLSGFLRVLTRLATHDWQSSPLIVAPFHVFYSGNTASGLAFNVTELDVDTDLTREMIEEIYAKFEQSIEKRACLYIATPHDLTSKYFTVANVAVHSESDTEVLSESNVADPWGRSSKLVALPGPVETSRLQLFASLTRAQIVKLIAQSSATVGAEKDNDNTLTWTSLFKTPLEAYDSFILLKPSSLSMHDQRKSLFTFLAKTPIQTDKPESTTGTESKKKGYKLPVDISNSKADNSSNNQEKRVLPEVYAGFEPVELYIHELRKAFGNIANFYYDSQGGRVIAIKLIDDIKSVLQGCITPRSGGNEVNLAAMFATMSELGEGLVEGVFTDFDALARFTVC